MSSRPAATQPLRQELRFTHLASGTRIAWACNGRSDPAAPTLLKVAHWMTHVEYDARSVLYRPWLERLGRAAHFVRYDERGCGLSGPDTAPLGMQASLEDLHAVAVASTARGGAVRASAATRVSLLGISGAAPVAVAYAAREPERVSCLVLLGGYLAGALAANATAEQHADVQAICRLMELGWGKAGSPVQQYFSASMVPDATPEQMAALTEQQRLSCDGQRAAAIVRSRVRLDVRELAPQVRCPTLVLHAADDGMVSVESGRQLAAAIPGARFVTLPSRNHVPLPGEAAFELFCDSVAEFLGEPVTGASGAQPGMFAEGFTPAENELLGWVARGCDNLQIAAELGIAEKTARNRLSRLYQRLQVEGRPQAVVRARELGFR